MAKRISASVGDGGVNRKDDSITVQTLLNNVPGHQGGPVPLLAVDGLPWQKTIAAIKKFQSVQLGFKWPDGRVDPNGLTLEKLNALSEPVNFEIQGVPLYGQKQMGLPAAAAENACWWASIKMVRDTGGVLPANPPPEIVRSNRPLNILQLEAISWRYQMFPPYPYPNPPTWTAAELVTALKKCGPMCAIGRFAVSDESTTEYDGHVQHAIVVYGVANNGQTVVCNDPWKPTKRRLFLGEFNSKLHVGRSRLLASTKHVRHWKHIPE